jgi:hypothetical protein
MTREIAFVCAVLAIGVIAIVSFAEVLARA